MNSKDSRGQGNLGLNLGSAGAKGGKTGFESSSQASLSSSYKVPSRDDGKFLLANPLKLCLKFRPPTIAVVYKLDPIGMNSRTLPAKSNKKYEKKYIHEIFVEPMLRTTDLRKLCDKLCENESYYLNPTIISKSQVIYMLTYYVHSKTFLGVWNASQALRKRSWHLEGSITSCCPLKNKRSHKTCTWPWKQKRNRLE